MESGATLKQSGVMVSETAKIIQMRANVSKVSKSTKKLVNLITIKSDKSFANIFAAARLVKNNGL